MLNLLPQKEKNLHVSEYRMRFALVSVAFVCTLLVIALIGLLPTYAIKRSMTTELLKEQDAAKVANTQAMIEEAEAKAADNEALADILEGRVTLLANPLTPSLIIDKVLEKAGASVVVVRSISIVDTSIDIRGIASTRDELIAFHQRLKAEADFKNASLPIGDIAKSVNPEFTIRIIAP